MTSLAEDAAALRKLKTLAAGVTAEAKALTQEAVTAELALFERMDQEGVQGIKVGNTNFVPVETNYGSVQDRAAFIEWANEHDKSLLETKERKSLINELVREHLDNGIPMPPGLGFYCKQYISQRSSG
jgi:hypothetical protein